MFKYLVPVVALALIAGPALAADPPTTATTPATSSAPAAKPAKSQSKKVPSVVKKKSDDTKSANIGKL